MDQKNKSIRRVFAWIGVTAFFVFTAELIDITRFVSSQKVQAGEKVRLVKGVKSVPQVTFESDPHSAGEYASSPDETLRSKLIGQSADQVYSVPQRRL